MLQSLSGGRLWISKVPDVIDPPYCVVVIVDVFLIFLSLPVAIIACSHYSL